MKFIQDNTALTLEYSLKISRICLKHYVGLLVFTLTVVDIEGPTGFLVCVVVHKPVKDQTCPQI